MIYLVVEGPFTVSFTDISTDDVKKIGNKAANLSLLMAKAFSVPEGYVIKTSAYTLFLMRNKLDNIIQDSLNKIKDNDYNSIEVAAKSIKNAIEGSPLPIELTNEISAKYPHYDSYYVAVRSSATAEDLPSASFAGQYDTYLNLKGLKQIFHHIKQCYASLWTGRAISYRIKNMIPHNSVKIATIVQKMISPKSAGVLFTANPITSDISEILIESNFGLGESLVSGQINPDQYIIQKILKKGKKVFKIINKRIGKKKFATFSKETNGDSGIEQKILSEQKSTESSLSDKIIIKLARIGSEIENIFGGKPQDIEWAIDQDDHIHLLQSRPITSMSPQKNREKTIWSRGYSDDYWNDPVSPLFFELLGENLTKIVNIELNSILGYENIDNKLLKLYNGHVYFNLNVLKLKVENEIPKMVRNEDLLNYFPDGYGYYGKETIKNLPFHLKNRVIAEIRVMFYDPDGSITKTAVKYDEWTNMIFNPFCINFDLKFKKIEDTSDGLALFSLAEDLNRAMVPHFCLVRYGIPVHNIGMNLMTQYLLTRFLGKNESLLYYPVLISGLKHKLTETNEGIHSLAALIQDNSNLKSIILDNKSENIYNLLKHEKNSQIHNFLLEFDNFLKNFGDRGFTREPYYPRWSEKPMTHIFNILKSLTTETTHEKISKNFSSCEIQEKTEKIVEYKIRSQRFGFIKWKILCVILKLSRLYIIFRENQRFILDRWITRNRRVFLEIGKLLTNEGILKESNDIFFLKKREIEDLLHHKFNESEISKLKIEISNRKRDFLKFEHDLPPKFLLDSHEFNDVLKYSKDSSIFQGIPASHGIITGKIHIIRTINQISTVKANEILVVPRTDPGWTPVFSKIGGLITETGGVLSHGAVVSREYGIPAVTNVPNACKLFKNGQIVNINGYNGIITIKN